MLGMEDTHKGSHILATVLAAAIYVLTVILTFISQGPVEAARKGVFANNSLEIMQSYSTTLTTADWTHYTMWTMIFVWLAATFGYAFTTFYRFTSYGYLYIAPGHVKWNIYALLCFAMVLHISWLFILDKKNFAWTFILSLLTTGALFVTLIIALQKMYTRGLILQREEAIKEIWLCRITLHNALDLYASWFFYLMLLNFNAELVHGFGVADHMAGVGTMGFMLVVVVGFFCLDIFVLDKYTRYCITGYVAFMLGLCGSVVNNWNGSSSVTIITTLTLIASSVALGLKLAFTTIRHKREPIWTGSTMFLQQRSYGATDERQKSGSQNLTYSSSDLY